MDLEGKVVLVTGATRGIGRALATRFAAEGARVAVNGRSTAAVDEVASSLGGAGLGVVADVADPGQADAMVERVVGEWGRLDVLVNNAGVARDGFITRLSNEAWAETIATNLSGPFWCLRAAVRVMKGQEGGSVVNLVSWAGLRGNVGQAAYAASKAGLHGLTLAAAKELAKFGVRVNALSPVVATELSGHMPAELKAKVVQRVPMHRRGTFDEVAEAAVFLASDRSSFTTGQVLHVDGGLHLV